MPVSYIMKLNLNTKIVGKNVILVPYRNYHVLKYHNWMKSQELQKLTASEPLTLDEEYKMQKSWQEDDDKCTFIILDKSSFEQNTDEIESMIGDTNIFITDRETMTGEIEIMIAEPTARGKKFGWEAVVLMLVYGILHVKIQKFEAKIATYNVVSIKLFEKLGFEEIHRSTIFDEITLKKYVTDEWLQFLKLQCEHDLQVYTCH